MKFIYPDRLSRVLIDEMTAYEAYVVAHFPDAKIIINNDWAERGHAENSRHYLGEAVDFHVENVSPLNAWLALERFLRIGGIGYYPGWKPLPGFHADVRVVPYRARWARAGSNYVGLDHAIIQGLVLV